MQGACRVWGMLALGQRVGILKKVQLDDVIESTSTKQRKGAARDGVRITKKCTPVYALPSASKASGKHPASEAETIALGIASETFEVTRTATAQLRNLVQHANAIHFHKELKEICCDDGYEAMIVVQAALGTLHENLDGWAMAKGEYIGPHICRKFLMLVALHFEFKNDTRDPPSWPKTSEALNFLEQGSPDHMGHLKQALPSFASGRLAWAILKGVNLSPLEVTMWLSFWCYATTQYPNIAQWLQEADRSPGHFFS